MTKIKETMNESSTEFDNELSINNVLYYPWIGQSYKNTTLKVLVVGESHYYGSDCEKNKIKNRWVKSIRKVMFDSLLSMIATLFILLAVGFLAGKCNIIDGIASKRLSALILKVAQPALIIESLIGMEYSR